MPDRSPQQAPERPGATVGRELERALTELMHASRFETLSAATGRLLGQLAPNARLDPIDAIDEVSFKALTEANERIRTVLLPPGELGESWLQVTLPETDPGAVTAFRLLQAKGRQLRALNHIRASNKRLERAERLQRALYAIAEQASGNRDMSGMMRALHGIVGSLMYAENFYIVLYDANRRSLRFPYFSDVVDPDPPDPEHDFPLEELQYSLTWHLLHGGRPLRGALNQLTEVLNGEISTFGPDCVDWLGVPLLRGDDVVGAVVVQSYVESARYTEQDQTLLTYVAQHIQTAIERRMAHAELEHRVAKRTEELSEANQVLQTEVLERQRGERLQTALFRIAELANTTESLDDFYAAVHKVVGGLLYARNFYIALISEDHQTLTFPYSVDEFDAQRKPRKRGKGLTEYVLRHGTAMLADRDDIARLRAQGDLVQSGADAVCWLGVPLVCDERTVGVLTVQSYSDQHRYSARDQELVTFVSYHIANALERKRNAESLKLAYADLERRVTERTRALAAANRDLRQQIVERERIEQRLKYETLHDSLTGLPNRSLLLERLGQALERYTLDHRHVFAVLFLDLDRFKVINDSVGHLVGDDLLFQAGGRIRACLKSQDVVARLGGDEFAVLLEGIADAGAACVAAERIIAELNVPFRLGIKELFTSTSIGIAMAAPHYVRPEELLRDADSAMYRAKAEGRQRFALFDDRLRREAVSLLELGNDLRRALARNEFEPYFQPIVRLDDGSLVGYEALLRWQHPERGLLPPGEFLHVAEENGSSELIDWQIFEQVLKLAPGLVQDNLFVSINLSGRHFRSRELDQRLLNLLETHGVAARNLRIEMTERAMLENPAQVKRTLESLRGHGVGVALDDFGTGYSSLSYLHQYPLESLKIDRSFITNLEVNDSSGSAAVIRAIQALADSLGMQVIAEGIETESQRQILQNIGCQFGQGFLFAHPQPAETWPRKVVNE